MKFILIISALAMGIHSQAQSRFSLSLDNSVGLIQLQERELYRFADRNKYTPRYGLGLSASVKLFNTDLEVGAGVLYSWSTVPIFVGGLPIFPKHREGFPSIQLNNNHWEGRFFVQHPFIKKKKVHIGGLLGVDIGWPNFSEQVHNFYEGTVYTTNSGSGSDMQLDYQVYLTNMRNSVAIRSGIYLTLMLSEYVSFNTTVNYRWGLIQSVDYSYFGEIYFNDDLVPMEDSFEKFFSNSGAFLDVGLKWTLVTGKQL
jgi:hypothetical protein